MEVEKVIEELEEARKCGNDNTPWMNEILDNAIQTIRELQELTNGLSETHTSNPMYELGYKKGATDMEQAKQIIIDKLQEQIPKWHYVADNDYPSDNERLNSKLCWDEYRERCVFARYCDGRWILGNDDEPIKVIAWMELPKFEEVE